MYTKEWNYKLHGHKFILFNSLSHFCNFCSKKITLNQLYQIKG